MPNILRKTIAATAVFTLALSSLMLVPRASEFSPYADTLVGVGIIDPKPSEAQYRFRDSITRAEVAKIVVKLRGENPSGCQGNIYSDVTATLGDLCGYVEAAAKAGIVSRQETFRPTEPVTRAELAKMIFSGAGISSSETLAGFRDVPSSLGDLVGYINAGVSI